MKSRYDQIVLGENTAYDSDCSKTHINNNVLVVGGSGCGKTMSIIEPRLLETYNSSLIVAVTKRRIVNMYIPLFLERGYDVQDLNFAKPSQCNIAYDPLEYVDSYSDITFLAESIVKADPMKKRSSADPYWDQAAVSLLSAEIAYILMTKDDATFADVLELHDGLSIRENGGQIETTLDQNFEAIAREAPGCFALSCWNSFRSLPIRTASCIFGTLNATIDKIFSPELRNMIKLKNKVNFEKLASRKTVLFITTSAVNPTLNCFINMFYAHAFKQLFEYAERLPNGKLPIPVSILCDDFAVGSRIINFPEYISVFREKQISVTLLIQSESQLESMYGSDSTTIINNCDTYVFMGGMDLNTGRSVSERLNVPLDEVLYMPIGDVVIFRRGQRPVITQRYNVFQSKLHQKVTRRYENLIALSER